MNGSKVYEYEYVSSTEEGLQADYLKGWRRFRIGYHEKGTGFSNLEGTLYFPPEFDPYPVLDEVCDRLNNVSRRD